MSLIGPRVPARILRHEGGPQVEWLIDDGVGFAEPFFEDTLRRLRSLPANHRNARARTPLVDLARRPLVNPTAFLFHVSRCGSTLVSQMLAALPQSVVVSEAPILDDVLRIHHWNPQTTDASRIELFRGAIAALGANATSNQRLFIKLDCWHLFELELIESAFPGIPKYFLFRNPLEVVVSLLRQPSLTLLPNIIPSHHVIDSCRTPGSPGYSLAAYAAAGQGAFYRFATARRETLIPIDYRQLPQFVWESLPRMTFSLEERAILKEASQFNSKNPTSRFSADSAEKQRSASAEIRHYVTQLADPFYFEWLDQIHANSGGLRTKSIASS